MSRVSPFVARSFSRRSRASPRSFAPSDVLNLTSAPRPASSLHAADPVEDRDGAEREDLSEIGKLAVWSVTSAKPGNGVELLRDNNLDTYWQSDGAQPHLVNIQFQKRCASARWPSTPITNSTSRTPSKISIRAGNSFHDLREIKVVDLEEPVGWMHFRLRAPNDAAADADDDDEGECLRAYSLQLAVLSNHQNGRDTHVRQVKIYGPRTSPMAMIGNGLTFTTVEFGQYATVR